MISVDISIAAEIVTIFIIISGILIGVGKALENKRIELFGIEELFQSVINAAIIGAYATLIVAISSMSADVVEEFDVACSTDTDVLNQTTCLFENTTQSSLELTEYGVQLADIVSYYQSLVLELNSITVQPFQGFSSTVNSLNIYISSIQAETILLMLNTEILSFFADALIVFFLPLGIVFRSFLGTRKLGGFLIALSIGFYLLYPSLLLLFPLPSEDISVCIEQVQNFTSNPSFAVMPLIDLNDAGVVATRLDEMRSGDIVGSLNTILQCLSQVSSKILFFSLFAPILSIIITVIFIKSLGDVIGGEFAFSSKSV